MAGVEVPVIRTGVLYDTAAVTSGASSIGLWTNTISGQGREITNLRKANEINTTSFELQGIEAIVESLTKPSDFNDIWEYMYIITTLDGQEAFILPCAMLSARVAPQGFEYESATAGEHSFQPYSSGRIFAFKEPVALKKEMALEGGIKSDKNNASVTLASTTSIKVVLHGDEGAYLYAQ